MYRYLICLFVLIIVLANAGVQIGTYMRFYSDDQCTTAANDDVTELYYDDMKAMLEGDDDATVCELERSDNQVTYSFVNTTVPDLAGVLMCGLMEPLLDQWSDCEEMDTGVYGKSKIYECEVTSGDACDDNFEFLGIDDLVTLIAIGAGILLLLTLFFVCCVCKKCCCKSSA